MAVPQCWLFWHYLFWKSQVDKASFTKLVYSLCFTKFCSIKEADISIVNTRQDTASKRSGVSQVPANPTAKYKLLRNAAIAQCEDLVQPAVMTSIPARSCILSGRQKCKGGFSKVVMQESRNFLWMTQDARIPPTCPYSPHFDATTSSCWLICGVPLSQLIMLYCRGENQQSVAIVGETWHPGQC